MSGKFQNPDELPRLLTVATEREHVAIEAVVRHGNAPDAARELGLSLSCVHQRIDTARNRFRKRALGEAAPPDGFTPTHVATDAEGRIKTVRSRAENPEAHVDPQPEGFVLKRVSTYRNAAGEIAGQWGIAEPGKQHAWQAFETAVRDLAAEVPAAPPAPPAPHADADLATILPWGDPHIGALAWAAECGHSWDLKIAEEVTGQVLADLINRTPRSTEFHIVDLGDLFHAEDDRQATPTAGHKLDVDSRAGKIARVALRMCRQAVDLALLRHGQVTFRALRGNHDPYKTLMLTIWLEAIYRNEPRVTIERSDNPYQFWQWGQSAFMWHHGDGSKPQQMPGIFSCDPSWGDARWRYIQTGHIHSQNRWDFPGCTVESFRTVFPGDYWAHWKGYRSGRTLDAITYHKDLGEVSRVQRGVVSR